MMTKRKKRPKTKGPKVESEISYNLVNLNEVEPDLVNLGIWLQMSGQLFRHKTRFVKWLLLTLVIVFS